MTTLAELGLTAQGGAEALVTGLAVDSRDVKAGYLFAALPGTKVHGGEFIQYALRMGASAILTDAEGARIAADVLAMTDAALIVAQDPRQTLAQTASLWFGAHPRTVVAVTGTNGKTSVSTFCRQIWEELGIAGVNLGTTGVEGAWAHPLKHTTPEPITLHRVLAEAARNGVSHVAMEASSHGLDQRRLDGVVLAAAGFTNFTQDHLDYHETFEAYFAAKAGLFERVLTDDGVAVVNLDDPKGEEVARLCTKRGQEVIGVGRHPAARLRLTGQRFDATGQDVLFTWQERRHQVRLALIGGFQAENVLLAAGLVIAAGADPQDVFDALPHLGTVHGRMELAATRESGAAVFVDYAHTPDAVETALKAMRPHVMGRIIVIVGAGGDRDVGKRPLMGAAAAQNADIVIVTDDNPRSEDPASIRAAVLAGAVDAGAESVTEVGDRAEAILRGIDMLGAGDALLIAGKGHETGQIVGDSVLPFDDVEQASVAVAALEGRI
ncbi:UDP-N-acetylmuramoyl-L-alanyl-D-glutamate--2,6-diaminopimelate ligase [Yoonia sediminilitoris]|uniref:UDP-N-acetylmuramoyl-L-alanyl-D-glutamate--2,6-diaminopimelate ligase n=1 Tax=Yoonia sediminilitoris TaxID=1286148 RepID=A0A2T6KER7_9RHOB|nr:UDP-N-acetylmuramoyl-L-alanyl-D-glutamate--2,6-diaminopimelate ligase [Yoonia sediminilitoris]PUB13587.1 UDP-N-acetylmuramoylalanyl-D-glutamate--2,6-diaminopimelate ligase [Yoonia sediminilitoris]RCW94757.1 UDP-N-acetylmuramoylalanyl-D-glutamate--2,6-diaminopimelate ligase [Yoonia sediminilitoris]